MIETVPTAMRWYWLFAAVVLLWGCTSSSGQDGSDPTITSDAAQPSGASETGPERAPEPAAGLHELSRLELVEGPAAQELEVSELLRRVGVLELLGTYVINIPPTAEFISSFELLRGWTANDHHFADADPEGEISRLFENRILSAALSALESLPNPADPTLLHDAFFDALDECARESSWPDVELYVIYDGRGADVLPERVEPEFGISQFDYLQLRHECARYAVTYPTLDPEERDRLLAPQRAHFARVILDRLDNELPRVEVPDRYQAEIDDLRANGW
ncbi:MAG: hypothetical protein OXF61_17160 [Acidimicrobiaceae bacterium]|nr:hypothetical protein [Acidimicrobiaceae bacterium]